MGLGSKKKLSSEGSRGGPWLGRRILGGLRSLAKGASSAGSSSPASKKQALEASSLANQVEGVGSPLLKMHLLPGVENDGVIESAGDDSSTAPSSKGTVPQGTLGFAGPSSQSSPKMARFGQLSDLLGQLDEGVDKPQEEGGGGKTPGYTLRNENILPGQSVSNARSRNSVQKTELKEVDKLVAETSRCQAVKQIEEDEVTVTPSEVGMVDKGRGQGGGSSLGERQENICAVSKPPWQTHNRHGLQSQPALLVSEPPEHQPVQKRRLGTNVQSILDKMRPKSPNCTGSSMGSSSAPPSDASLPPPLHLHPPPSNSAAIVDSSGQTSKMAITANESLADLREVMPKNTEWPGSLSRAPSSLTTSQSGSVMEFKSSFSSQSNEASTVHKDEGTHRLWANDGQGNVFCDQDDTIKEASAALFRANQRPRQRSQATRLPREPSTFGSIARFTQLESADAGRTSHQDASGRTSHHDALIGLNSSLSFDPDSTEGGGAWNDFDLDGDRWSNIGNDECLVNQDMPYERIENEDAEETGDGAADDAFQRSGCHVAVVTPLSSTAGAPNTATAVMRANGVPLACAEDLVASGGAQMAAAKVRAPALAGTACVEPLVQKRVRNGNTFASPAALAAAGLYPSGWQTMNFRVGTVEDPGFNDQRSRGSTDPGFNDDAPATARLDSESDFKAQRGLGVDHRGHQQSGGDAATLPLVMPHGFPLRFDRRGVFTAATAHQVSDTNGSTEYLIHNSCQGTQGACGLCRVAGREEEMCISGCKHAFHGECVKSYILKVAQQGSDVLCPVCFDPFNIAVPGSSRQKRQSSGSDEENDAKRVKHMKQAEGSISSADTLSSKKLDEKLWPHSTMQRILMSRPVVSAAFENVARTTQWNDSKNRACHDL